MIKILSVFSFLLLFSGESLTAASNSDTLADSTGSLIYDFGIAKKDIATARIFKIYNNSHNTVRIRTISATPYCNVPVWSTRPIKPGKYGLIKVIYNGAKTGAFTADLTIIYYDNELIKSEEIPKNIIIQGVIND